MMASAATGLGAQRSAILIEAEPIAGPSSMADDMEEGEVAEEKKAGFHVNTRLIPKALLEEHSELEGLGLGVFNQQDFEDGRWTLVLKDIQNQVTLYYCITKVCSHMIKRA